MMVSFADRALVARDQSFRARVVIGLTRVALRASEEAKPRQSWTRKRLDLATMVLRDPEAMAARFALVLASQDVPTTATDEEIETLIAQAWDALAGVGVEDR